MGCVEEALLPTPIPSSESCCASERLRPFRPRLSPASSDARSASVGSPRTAPSSRQRRRIPAAPGRDPATDVRTTTPPAGMLVFALCTVGLSAPRLESTPCSSIIRSCCVTTPEAASCSSSADGRRTLFLRNTPPVLCTVKSGMRLLHGVDVADLPTCGMDPWLPAMASDVPWAAPGLTPLRLPPDVAALMVMVMQRSPTGGGLTGPALLPHARTWTPAVHLLPKTPRCRRWRTSQMGSQSAPPAACWGSERCLTALQRLQVRQRLCVSVVGCWCSASLARAATGIRSGWCAAQTPAARTMCLCPAWIPAADL
eukprot:363869-Chlamydomonas_euryale.AAC.31